MEYKVLVELENAERTREVEELRARLREMEGIKRKGEVERAEGEDRLKECERVIQQMGKELEEKGCEIGVLRVMNGNMESQLRQEMLRNASAEESGSKSRFQKSVKTRKSESYLFTDSPVTSASSLKIISPF